MQLGHSVVDLPSDSPIPDLNYYFLNGTNRSNHVYIIISHVIDCHLLDTRLELYKKACLSLNEKYRVYFGKNVCRMGHEQKKYKFESIRTRQKTKNRDRNGELNERPEIPDRG